MSATMGAMSPCIPAKPAEAYSPSGRRRMPYQMSTSWPTYGDVRWQDALERFDPYPRGIYASRRRHDFIGLQFEVVSIVVTKL